MNTIVFQFLVLSDVALAQNGAPPAADSTHPFPHLQRDRTQNTWHTALAGNDAGTWFCAWQMRSTQGAVIRGTFLARGQREGLPVIEVSNPETGTEDGRPAVAFLTDSTVLVAWLAEDSAVFIWHQGEEGAFHIAGQWMRNPNQRAGLNFCLSCGKE